MKLLLKNGCPVDSRNELPEKVDILIENNKIVKIAENIDENDTEIINLDGAKVLPGLIDMHVHLREPGYEEKETIKTGCEAAAAGGITTVAAMPNTDPIADNPATIELIKARAQEALVDVVPLGSITKGSSGKELAEIGFLSRSGVKGITDDGNPVMDSEVMRRAMEYSRPFDLPIISHCEDLNLAAEGVMHEGFYSTKLGLKPIPAAAEEVMIARDIALADLTGARLHIAHLSTARGFELVKAARENGIKVTAEVTPHHLTLTDADLQDYNTAMKVNPPLRSVDDRDTLIKAVKDGQLSVIATDHAPHTYEEKMGTIDSAAFGISGLETALSVLHHYLIRKGNLDWNQITELMYYNPAEILRLDKEGLKIGSIADLTIFAENESWTVDTNKFKSLGKHSPYNGKELTGTVKLTIKDGKIIYDNRGGQGELIY